MHNDYPLAPEKIEISHNMLSKYCRNISKEYGIKIGSVNKLVPNLSNKSKYVLHYENLQLYLSVGIKLTKIHRILKFKQRNLLKKYNDFNTGKKMLLIVLKNIFFKLMNNSTFGAIMEILRKRINVVLVNILKTIKNGLADQVLFHRKFLMKILLLFMKLNQF